MAGTRSPSPATTAQPCTGQSFGEADPLLAWHAPATPATQAKPAAVSPLPSAHFQLISRCFWNPRSPNNVSDSWTISGWRTVKLSGCRLVGLAKLLAGVVAGWLPHRTVSHSFFPASQLPAVAAGGMVEPAPSSQISHRSSPAPSAPSAAAAGQFIAKRQGVMLRSSAPALQRSFCLAPATSASQNFLRQLNS